MSDHTCEICELATELADERMLAQRYQDALVTISKSPDRLSAEIATTALQPEPGAGTNPILVGLAAREQTAARVGGRTWQEFVGRCERELGEPWETIRERFNELGRATLAKKENR